MMKQIWKHHVQTTLIKAAMNVTTRQTERFVSINCMSFSGSKMCHLGQLKGAWALFAWDGRVALEPLDRLHQTKSTALFQWRVFDQLFTLQNWIHAGQAIISCMYIKLQSMANKRLSIDGKVKRIIFRASTAENGISCLHEVDSWFCLIARLVKGSNSC